MKTIMLHFATGPTHENAAVIFIGNGGAILIVKICCIARAGTENFGQAYRDTRHIIPGCLSDSGIHICFPWETGDTGSIPAEPENV